VSGNHRIAPSLLTRWRGFRRAAIDRELGDLYCQATDYDRLGDAHHAAGSTTQARHAWQLALNILDQFSDVPA
jgi:hypothetical protein